VHAAQVVGRAEPLDDYERYYSGDPVRLAGTLYGLYDKDTHITESSVCSTISRREGQANPRRSIG
jgi:hypothetical protein